MCHCCNAARLRNFGELRRPLGLCSRYLPDTSREAGSLRSKHLVATVLAKLHYQNGCNCYHCFANQSANAPTLMGDTIAKSKSASETNCATQPCWLEGPQYNRHSFI